MSANITYVATAHDGTVCTRSSKTMLYTHAIIVQSNGTSGPYSWHQSHAAAVKATGTVQKRVGKPGTRIYIVDVTGYPYSSPEAKRARNGETPEPVAELDTRGADPELLAKNLFRVDHDRTDKRRWAELTDAERAVYYERAGHPAPVVAEPVAEPEPVIERQTCRVCLEATEPAVTVDASDELGARRFHFCAEHAAAAEDYRTEPAPVVDAEIADEPTHTLVVVPCSAGKVDHPAPAAELYNTPNFRHALAGARAHAAELQRTTGNPARVVILSALHGLLELDETVRPYDVMMGDEHSIDAQRLADQIALLAPARIAMMLPGKYRDRLVAAVEIADPNRELVIDDLYAGTRGIGEQRAVASRMLRTDHAAVLREAPAGTYVQGRSIDYRKSDRGDWATVSSTPDRYTSAQLATILGQPEQPAEAPAPAPAPAPAARRSLRSIRVEDDLWQAAQSKAKGNGDNVSEILRAALQAYIAQ